MQALRALSTYCLHSAHTVTSSLTSVVLCRSHCRLITAAADGLSSFVLFLTPLLLPKVYFLWLELQIFVLGQSVPPPLHLPGGFPEKPEMEVTRLSNKIRFHKLYIMIRVRTFGEKVGNTLKDNFYKEKKGALLVTKY